jgi:hypothetical protein
MEVSIYFFANAGIQAFRPLLEMEDPDWHIQIEKMLNMAYRQNRLRAFPGLNPTILLRQSCFSRRMVSGATYDVTGGDNANNTA